MSYNRHLHHSLSKCLCILVRFSYTYNVADGEAEEAGALTLHANAFVGEEALAVTEPLIVRLRESRSAGGEFSCHAFVDLAVANLFQKVRGLLFLLLLDLVNYFQIGLASILT